MVGDSRAVAAGTVVPGSSLLAGMVDQASPIYGLRTCVDQHGLHADEFRADEFRADEFRADEFVEPQRGVAAAVGVLCQPAGRIDWQYDNRRYR